MPLLLGKGPLPAECQARRLGSGIMLLRTRCTERFCSTFLSQRICIELSGSCLFATMCAHAGVPRRLVHYLLTCVAILFVAARPVPLPVPQWPQATSLGTEATSLGTEAT